jgi:hypothetical protein
MWFIASSRGREQRIEGIEIRRAYTSVPAYSTTDVEPPLLILLAKYVNRSQDSQTHSIPNYYSV